MRRFVVGDIHGCKNELLGLLELISYDPSQDQLIFIGDYIDRGPDPKGVVDTILELRNISRHELICILGNHEAMFLDVIEGFGLDLFLYNGGGTTLKSYGVVRPGPAGEWLPLMHRDFFLDLRPYLELENYIIVHAGLRPGIPLEKQSLEDLTWIREPFISSDMDFGKVVIFGHTPFREPLVMKNKIGIDTGAVYGNMLTCVELNDMRFYSYPSKQRRYLY